MAAATLRRSLTTWSLGHTRSQLQVQDTARCREQGCRESRHSHGVIEHNILLGKLQQHGIIEELADAYILTQALQRVGVIQEKALCGDQQS